MKKIIVSVFLLIIVLSLSACSSPYPQRTPLSYVGVIRQNGASLILETDDGVLRVRSSFLDLAPYLTKKVKIHGQFSQDIFFIDDVKPAAN